MKLVWGRRARGAISTNLFLTLQKKAFRPQNLLQIVLTRPPNC